MPVRLKPSHDLTSAGLPCPEQNRSHRGRGVRRASWNSSHISTAEAEDLATKPVLRSDMQPRAGKVRLKPDATTEKAGRHDRRNLRSR